MCEEIRENIREKEKIYNKSFCLVIVSLLLIK
jgi:hypothetical protein